ncbi:MAG: uncharacterized protein A8A55_2366 [Amphiamblys sp. WSBS2006]|nr:MAG: uncharacterized protein A8A55_2366 [Amphiamblys sp. WSBS2006]
MGSGKNETKTGESPNDLDRRHSTRIAGEPVDDLKWQKDEAERKKKEKKARKVLALKDTASAEMPEESTPESGGEKAARMESPTGTPKTCEQAGRAAEDEVPEESMPEVGSERPGPAREEAAGVESPAGTPESDEQASGSTGSEIPEESMPEIGSEIVDTIMGGLQRRRSWQTAQRQKKREGQPY